MGVIKLNCKSCDEILHEDEFTTCLICKNREECYGCAPSGITFKKNKERFVCESCICDPLKYSDESDLNDIAKDLKITPNFFLKVLKEEKDKSYGPDILIDEFKKNSII